jgi:hypothetical protein
MLYSGNAPDIGAFENNQLVQGPLFRFESFPHAKEKNEFPRITGYRLHDHLLEVHFSIPMDPKSFTRNRLFLSSEDRLIQLTAGELSGDGFVSRFQLEEKPTGAIKSLIIRNRLKAKNGNLLTNWATALPVEWEVH